MPSWNQQPPYPRKPQLPPDWKKAWFGIPLPRTETDVNPANPKLPPESRWMKQLGWEPQNRKLILTLTPPDGWSS